MNFGGTIRLNRTGWLLVFLVAMLILFIHFSRSKPSTEEEKEENMVNLKALLIGAIEASQLGGKKVITGTKGELNIKSKGKTQEGANDPVTDADFASHCEMYNGLLKAFPRVHIRSEEEQAKGDTCPEGPTLRLLTPVEFSFISSLADEFVHPEDVTVWIDPLDATKEYTDKLYKYVTTMVCVAVGGIPLIGVIHKPFSGETSWAWHTKMQSPDLQSPKEPEGSKESPRIIVSMSHKGLVDSFASKAFGSHAPLTSAAGAGYKVLEVARGTADLYLHKTEIKKWDICAGNAIITSLGGRMSTLNNETIDYSYDSDVVNKHGLLVAIQNHSFYVNKVKLVNSSQ